MSTTILERIDHGQTVSVMATTATPTRPATDRPQVKPVQVTPRVGVAPGVAKERVFG